MKRFLLFAGCNYYPSGGWQDFQSSHDTELEAVMAAANLSDGHDWWHVIDTERMGMIANGNRT